MISLPHNKLLISQSFDSFEELAALARAWDADFRQVGRSETDHRLLQVVMGGVLMSRGRFGCQLDQRGNTPKGLRTFALLEEGCSEMYWFGRRVGPNDLLIFPVHGEIEVISRPGFCNHTFSVAMADLAEFFETSKGPDLHKVLGPEDTVIPLAPVQLRRLRRHLRRVSFSQGELRQSLALYDAYREKLFSLLLDIFTSNAPNRSDQRHRLHHQVIRDVIAVVQDCREERPSLEDLCVAGKVPERTLNEIFRRELGISPGAFVKGYRLFRVHRQLWHSDASHAQITDVANAWGFWHMGQFAADYRALYGELPSETLKRSN